MSGLGRPPRGVVGAGGVACLVALAVSVSGQDLLEHTPNLRGTEVTPARTARFEFLHRFELVGEDEKKVLNYPTFLLGVGFPHEIGAGATYVTNSEIGGGTPNEWEIWLRKRLGLGERVELTGTAAWNSAAESADGELAARVRLDRLSLFAVGRGFSSAFDSGDAEAALGGGALVELTPRLAIGADVARIVTVDDHPTAWSAGVHVRIPASPHTLGLVVSNVGATTLQGASRGVEEIDGDDAIRLGFAFTLPLGTFGQWARIFHGEPDISAGAEASIRDFAYGPTEIRVQVGETVRWINDDPVAHSVTADGGAFDSGLLEPGEGYSRRFDEPGTYAYHCSPHPFMTGRVVVEPRGTESREVSPGR